VNISKVDAVDDEKRDALVRKITKEAPDIPSNNTHFDLGDFTHAKSKQQTSAILSQSSFRIMKS